jgi:hypothetical protein
MAAKATIGLAEEGGGFERCLDVSSCELRIIEPRSRVDL